MNTYSVVTRGACIAALCVAASTLSAQSMLESRVAAAADGEVRMSFAVAT